MKPGRESWVMDPHSTSQPQIPAELLIQLAPTAARSSLDVKIGADDLNRSEYTEQSGLMEIDSGMTALLCGLTNCLSLMRTINDGSGQPMEDGDGNISTAKLFQTIIDKSKQSTTFLPEAYMGSRDDAFIANKGIFTGSLTKGVPSVENNRLPINPSFQTTVPEISNLLDPSASGCQTITVRKVIGNNLRSPHGDPDAH
jgi:hypothetical protein